MSPSEPRSPNALSPADLLTGRAREALARAFGPEFSEVDPVLRPSDFADVQMNAALALAKRLGRPPRDIAAAIVSELRVEDLCSAVAVSGPGFVNFTFRDEWIASAVVAAYSREPDFGVSPRVVTIDYSAPNVAKEMHVGHLRTTVVGDALARLCEHLGHRVIRQNHIGDWGTPFGMLIERLLEVGEDSAEAALLENDPNAFYQQARAEFDRSADFARAARERVVSLQAGDPETMRLWTSLLERSTAYFNRVYRTLDVTLTDADLAGESSYNDALAGICDELEAAGLAVHSEGALCVFLDGFTGREGKPIPLIVRKSDGGYGYATTDLATIKHRVLDLGADLLLYVIGAPQRLHLEMVFETARLAGWLRPDTEPVHVQIGNVLGADGKILRTRSGETLRLLALLDEAIHRAGVIVDDARPELDGATRADIARQVGIGAVKYADLSVAHDSEYTFDLDRMLALSGNTGPYLQYAVARIRSMLRRAPVPADPASGEEGFLASVEGGSLAPVTIGAASERALALLLLDYHRTLVTATSEYAPHRLCAYLFSVAQAFTTFYEECPVLKAESPTRESRLTLSAVTLRVLVEGLALLGVSAPESM